MKISDDKVVSLIYTLTVDGEVADQTTKENPLEFIFGMGYLLPKFEENIKELKAGDGFEFHLTATEGYGETDPNAIVELPKNIFEVDGALREDLLIPGNVIPMMNAHGGVMPGTVIEVLPEVVVMDFNHRMAGKELDFKGTILNVREATEAELTNGLHGERGGCDPNSCSSCGGGCGE